MLKYIMTMEIPTHLSITDLRCLSCDMDSGIDVRRLETTDTDSSLLNLPMSSGRLSENANNVCVYIYT